MLTTIGDVARDVKTQIGGPLPQSGIQNVFQCKGVFFYCPILLLRTVLSASTHVGRKAYGAPFRFAVHHCGRDPTQTSLVSCVVCRAGAPARLVHPAMQLFRHVSAFDRLGHGRCYGLWCGPETDCSRVLSR